MEGNELMPKPSQSIISQQIPAGPNSETSLAVVSRRTMLRSVAAMGAGAALSIRPIFAGMPVDSNPKHGRIDVHHHMLPPFYMDLRRGVPNVGAMPTWSTSKSIDDMEKNGVATAMLSLA